MLSWTFLDFHLEEYLLLADKIQKAEVSIYAFDWGGKPVDLKVRIVNAQWSEGAIIHESYLTQVHPDEFSAGTITTAPKALTLDLTAAVQYCLENLPTCHGFRLEAGDVDQGAYFMSKEGASLQYPPPRLTLALIAPP